MREPTQIHHLQTHVFFYAIYMMVWILYISVLGTSLVCLNFSYRLKLLSSSPKVYSKKPPFLEGRWWEAYTYSFCSSVDVLISSSISNAISPSRLPYKFLMVCFLQHFEFINIGFSWEDRCKSLQAPSCFPEPLFCQLIISFQAVPGSLWACLSWNLLRC